MDIKIVIVSNGTKLMLLCKFTYSILQNMWKYKNHGWKFKISKKID